MTTLSTDAQDPGLAASYGHCEWVARRDARSFYRGMRLTPEPRRSSIFAVYAWMRRIDAPAEGIDAPSWDFRAFAGATAAALEPDAPMPEGPIWPALRHTATRYELPTSHFETMIQSQSNDRGPIRIETFDELYRYCYGVASAVGLICARIWGAREGHGAAQLAEYRGVAFQLTNILRDVREDAQRNRFYLPREDLERFGCDCEQLQAGSNSEGFGRLMQFEAERARSYYDMSLPLERHLSKDCRSASYTMCQTYRLLLERIARNPAAVLTRRVSLPWSTKLGVALKAELIQRRSEA